MKLLIAFTLLLTGVVHLLPLSGIAGPLQLTRLYGVAADEPNVAILLRHRAVLFGMLGAFLVYAAFAPAWQPAAFLAGFLSVGSFVWLGRSGEGVNAQIARVVTVDVVLIGVLAIGAATLAWSAVSAKA